jgi:hypothetical protein
MAKSSSRFIHLAAVLGVLDFVVFAKIVMTDIIQRVVEVLIFLGVLFIILGIMFIVLGIKFIILLNIINEMGCWYIILLLMVSTPLYIIAIDNVVLVTSTIILIIHIFATINISKITSFVLALGL